jgi:hypothetical protein
MQAAVAPQHEWVIGQSVPSGAHGVKTPGKGSGQPPPPELLDEDEELLDEDELLDEEDELLDEDELLLDEDELLDEEVPPPSPPPPLPGASTTTLPPQAARTRQVERAEPMNKEARFVIPLGYHTCRC